MKKNRFEPTSGLTERLISGRMRSDYFIRAFSRSGPVPVLTVFGSTNSQNLLKDLDFSHKNAKIDKNSNKF